MAANNIPAKLKAADITRFATRAAQVEKVKPVISYWCNYWIVNQILSKNLHNSDEECLKYTTGLMDKLEKFKAENSDNDAVIDDMAGHAYVEQFGLETFQRADNAIRANRATLQTADTFQAAATFLELCQIWGELDAEIAAKIKFAKYHALRIAKAVKAGEDPNLSNPKTPGQEGETKSPPVGGNGPEIEVTQHPEQKTAEKQQQPTVEEAPDEADSVQRSLAQQSILNESLHPSRMASPVPARSDVPAPTDTTGVSRVSSAPSSEIPSPTYFPSGMVDMNNRMRQMPSHLSSALIPDLPAAPSDFPSPASSIPGTPSQLGGAPEAFPRVSSTFHSFPPPDPAALPPQAPLEPAGSALESPQPSQQPSRPLPPQEFGKSAHLLPTKAKPTLAPRSTPRSTVPPASSTSSAPGATRNAGPEVDDNTIAQAQKHARWAVSALNFDDVDTAIKELRNALALLGAQ
ncbi:hypothetical protein VTO42DRAFT_6726 [Malbranchea cinnamomea]